jgi:hypothetical protein
VVLVEDDGDADGVGDTVDNCPGVSNAAQMDSDNDGDGDACDTDDDNDGLADSADNCPLIVNPGQENSVHPGTTPGDACEDPDADGIVDASDNCPDDSNSPQADLDGDSLGDVCDPDDDNDGAVDTSDNCPVLANSGQENSDSDALGDACDYCPSTPNAEAPPNADQADFDNDALGDACDPDIDGDSIANGSDSEADGDLVPNVDESGCGSDPNNSLKRPEWTDGAFAGVDDDLDTQIDEPLPAGAEDFDCDGDGYKGSAEAVIYALTTPGAQDPCGTNGWPSDFVAGGIFNSTNKVNIADLNTFLSPRRLGANPGDPNFDPRWELQPGPGIFADWINVQDLNALLGGPSGYPPMLGGAKAFGGPACAGP